jgi:CheY-like chemotaxis protein
MKEGAMKESALNDKRVLAVDDETDVLDSLEELILADAPQCRVDRATTHADAVAKMDANRYDLAVLDIMGVDGFDLLRKIAAQGIPVVMLTAHALNPEALKKSIELGARAYLPKDKLAEIVPYLEDALTQDYPRGWGRLFDELRGHFDARFGGRWMETDQRFWSQFENKIAGGRNIKLS